LNSALHEVVLPLVHCISEAACKVMVQKKEPKENLKLEFRKTNSPQ
jgi:hypothetical protein